LPVLVADPNNPTVPIRYQQYNGYSGYSQYQGFPGNPTILSQNQDVNGMIDEGDEVIADRRYQAQFGGNDQIFGSEEMAGLHLSAGDFARINGASRLRQLMPFNFELNLQARAIRQRFTSDSYDRRQHGFAYSAYPAAAPRGNWEFNADIDGDGQYEFPPMVPGLAGGASDPAQPFRLETRAVIGAEFNNQDYSGGLFHQQLRLKLNRLLTTPFPTAIQAMGPNNAPYFRNLIPHPDMLNNNDNTPIPGSPGGAPAPTTFTPLGSLAQQEYWARHDRQKLARDLYVMLYLLGGANDALDHTTYSNADPDGPYDPMSGSGAQPRPLYQDWQLQEMAQFAVNYVDGFDRDNVITRFEYDKNLADGWNLDDNPYTTSEAGADRGEVFGVEAQMLTLSEALCIKQQALASGDNAATPYDDSAGGDRYFMYVELQNVNNKNVYLQNGAAKGQWRVRLHRVGSGFNDQSIVLKYDGLNNTPYIAPNRPFTIGTVNRSMSGADQFSDGTNNVFRAADLRIDIGNDSRFERIVPAVTDAGQQPNTDIPPGCNLDLIHDRDWNIDRYLVIQHGASPTLTRSTQSYAGVQSGTDASMTRGYFGQFDATAGNVGDTLQFILERRVHLDRTTPLVTDADQNNDNPWVVVDVLQDRTGQTLPQIINYGGLTQADSGNTILQNYAPNWQSLERSAPLDRSVTAFHNQAAMYSSSIGMPVNSNAPGQTSLWQPHFDRDYSSVMELFSVPLYGPDEVTARLAYNGKLLADSALPAGYGPGGLFYEVNVAGGKFTQPYNATQHTSMTNPFIHDNRWYRILELLEPPVRVNKQVEDFYQGQLLRLPAKVSLNGLRHPENLFALLDDPILFTLGLQENPLFEQQRDWWQQFILARDAVDPATSQILPGSPASRPFRDWSRAEGPLQVPSGTNIIPSLERTLARKLPRDSEDVNDNGTNGGAPDPGEDTNLDGTLYKNTTAVRRLLEARTQNDLGNNNVDYHTRHRLLAKVANHTTPRSNVFMVWTTVGFFEAYQPDPVNIPDVVQIGAEMADQVANRRRGYFIVDRSLLEDAYNSQTGTYDFRKFVQYRKTWQ
ncbi:MAG: hypothetical protein ACKV0T_05685, partial [Planctomycetales bacterium]